MFMCVYIYIDIQLNKQSGLLAARACCRGADQRQGPAEALDPREPRSELLQRGLDRTYKIGATHA